MKRERVLFLLLFILTAYYSADAQSNDFGIWNNITINKSVKKWNFAVINELRTKNQTSDLEMESFDFLPSYKLFKPLTVGAVYQYINWRNSGIKGFQHRHLFGLFMTGKKSYGNFSLAVRERFQTLYKEDVPETETNPVWTWRNRGKVIWNIPNSSMNLSGYVETFYQFNKPEGNKFNLFRYSLGTGYKINQNHYVEFFGLIYRSVHIESPVRRFILGLNYSYSF